MPQLPAEARPSRAPRAPAARALRVVEPQRGRVAPSRLDQLVPRPRLTRALAADVPLRVLVAPAGYGKTTALRQWELVDPRPFVWVAGASSRDLRRLEAEVRRPSPFVLVLDGLDRLTTPEAPALLATLLARLVPGCALAVASRREPPLPLGRMRADGDVVELRPRELAMTRGEAQALLERAGLRLGAEQAETLAARTEGWPAGVVLAGLALREQDEVAAAFERFAGDDRLVTDYLEAELLADLPADARAFLRRVAPLDELDGPLCDAVLGVSGSGALLRDLGRSNILLTAMDRAETRFRWHPLLADALRAEMRRREPERERHAHRRACDHLEARGELERAIAHALAANDDERVAGLVWRALDEQLGYGRTANVERWLGQVGRGRIARRPELALAAAGLQALAGDRDGVAGWALTAGAHLGTAPSSRRAQVETSVALLLASVARDGVAVMHDKAVQAYAGLPEDGALRGACCLAAGAGGMLSGNGNGERWLEEGVRRGAIGAPAVQALCQVLLALVASLDGRWHEADRLAALGRDQAERVGLGAHPASAFIYAVSSFVSAHRARAGVARADLRVARRLQERLVGLPAAFEALLALVLARTELRLGDVLAARRLLAECGEAASEAPDAVALHAWLDDARGHADAYVRETVAGPFALTMAELRVLGLLPSHFSLREISAELSVSANTVKTQAHALYRKLGASSRSEAVARAGRLGLIGDGDGPCRAGCRAGEGADRR